MMSGATGFEDISNFENQPNRLGYSVYQPIMTLTNSQIDYWIVANGRRYILVAKIEGDFYSAYGGFILPYGKPSEYPYPLHHSGTTNGPNNNTSLTTLGSFFKHTDNYQAILRAPSGAYHYVGADATNSWVTWPYELIDSALNFYGNLDGSYTLLPVLLYSGTDGGNIWGEFQGVKYVTGVGPTDLAAEDTITIGADTYLVIQNADKNDERSYAAILLE
jgi:hypothetical protein